MTQKVAYIWGPVTSFNGPLAALLVMKGWHVHFACKSSLNLLSLSPLDLRTQAQTLLDTALGGRDKARAFKDRLKLVDPSEALKNTNYDAIIFGALPPNFDESRSPRAPWSGADLKTILKTFKSVPIFVVSSIWGGVQKDGVVPEELEFARRKPLSNWEGICQQYEQRVLESLAGNESPWFLVRLPLISGDTRTGEAVKFSGIYTLLKELVSEGAKPFFGKGAQSIKLAYNPDSTLCFLPVDVAVNTFYRIIEDEARPRICNLVSTHMTLNREWLSYVAAAQGWEEIVSAESDGLNLPATLRKLLLDDVQVKTRNLFEVAGRYQLQPIRLEKEYFQKLIERAKQENFGAPAPEIAEVNPLDYTEQLAKYYFEKFVPEKISQGALANARIDDVSIGFHLRAGAIHGWILKRNQATADLTINQFDPGSGKPDICFHFSGMTLSRLIQNKMHLHRALLMREVEVEGNLFQLWKIVSAIDKFLRDNPISGQDIRSQIEVLQD
jgi:putative sterol carrier protein